MIYLVELIWLMLSFMQWEACRNTCSLIYSSDINVLEKPSFSDIYKINPSMKVSLFFGYLPELYA